MEKDSVKGSDGKGKGLDWAAVNSFTEKTNARLKERRSGMAVLGKFTPGATLAGIHVSPSLAGPQRYQAITELVQSHWKESGVEHREGHWGGVLQCPEPLDWDKALLDAMGSCRRALTASDDYVLRRLLRKDPPQQRVSHSMGWVTGWWVTAWGGSQHGVGHSMGWVTAWGGSQHGVGHSMGWVTAWGGWWVTAWGES